MKTGLIKFILYVIVFFVCQFPTVSSAASCSLVSADIEENLALSWEQFDQTLGQGHRKWTNAGCFLEAALLIDAYTLHHQNSVQAYQSRILFFHAGQNYGYALLNNVAAKRMEKALNPDEDLYPELNWNDYVHASIAFMENRKVELHIFRDRLAAGKPTSGNQMNLNVVDDLIRCFGKPYSWAFEKPNKCD